MEIVENRNKVSWSLKLSACHTHKCSTYSRPGLEYRLQRVSQVNNPALGENSNISLLQITQSTARWRGRALEKLPGVWSWWIVTTGSSLGTFFTKLFLEVLHVLFYADNKTFRLVSCNLGSRAPEQTDVKLIKCKWPNDHVIMTSGRVMIPVTRAGAGAVMSDVRT